MSHSTTTTTRFGTTFNHDGTLPLGTLRRVTPDYSRAEPTTIEIVRDGVRVEVPWSDILEFVGEQIRRHQISAVEDRHWTAFIPEELT